MAWEFLSPGQESWFEGLRRSQPGSYGERNTAQLSLFDVALVTRSPLPEAEAALLNDLTISHFGNWREGLVKWYIGAQVTDQRGRQRWAWIDRQDLPETDADGGQPVRLRPTRPQRPGGASVTPFDAHPVEDVEVRPRTRPLRTRSTEDDSE